MFRNGAYSGALNHSLQWELASIQRFGGRQMKQPDEQHASSKQRSKVR